MAIAAAGLLDAMWPEQAAAVPPPISIPAEGEDNPAPGSAGAFGFLDGLNRSNTLLGDFWGLRKALSRNGISLAFEETGEELGNVSGGAREGFAYDGLTQVLVQVDTKRAFGHYGGLLNASLLNIHGVNLSATNLETLQTSSGIEGDRATRLWELWYDQKFLDEDRLDIKFGQVSLDQEFMVSTNALAFVNTMFGWPMLPSADLPGGGPAYPLSALGARISVRPVNGLTVLAGLFNGTPVKDDDGTDPQLQDRHGTSFPLGGGYLAIAEMQLSYPAVGRMVEPGESDPLGWTYRFGAWYDSRSFADQRFDASGLSLADPAAPGNPLMHHGDYAIYVVADRLVWRDAVDPNRNAAVFLRAMATPLRDRNPIDASLNAGVLVRSPFRYRTDDTFGIGFGYAHVSRQAAQFDQDSNILAGAGMPVRGHESFVELTYQYQLKPWIQIQPDLQYVFNPGAGLANPVSSGRRIADECVIGVRTNISF